MANDESTPDAPGASRFEREWRVVVFTVAVLGIASALAYGLQFDSPTFFRVVGLSVVVAGAGAMGGGVLGFLFGVPFTRAGDQPTGDETTYRPNTSLEQVSDWLTKIIVGIGLVQIGRAPRALSSLAHGLGPAFAPESATSAQLPAAQVFSVGLSLYFAIAGFLAGYLWARLSLPRAFRSADVVKQINELKARQEDLDARALTLVERVLAPDAGGSIPSHQQLAEAIQASTAPVRVQIFNRARTYRQENTDKVKKPAKVERTVSIFRALIAIDTESDYHRNHGQLGYALMSTPSPSYADAADEFSAAITTRGDWRTEGFLLYEYCRAICRIKADGGFSQGKPTGERPRGLMVEDIRAVASVPDLLQQLLEEPTVKEWLTLNNLNQTDMSGS